MHKHHQNCSHHPSDMFGGGENSSLESRKVSHVVKLIIEHIISPIKILYLMDPALADRFKLRNKDQGCCSSNYIKIPHSEQTQTEKWLASMLTPAHLTIHLDSILELCAQKHVNIASRGKEDKL